MLGFQKFFSLSLSLRRRRGPLLREVPPAISGGFLLQRFSEAFQRFSEVLKPGAKKTSGRFCCEPSFGGMSWPTLLAILAQCGDVIGCFSTRFVLYKGFASGVPQIPIM